MGADNAAATTSTSGAIAGIAGAAGGLFSQFSNNRGLKAFANARDRLAEREAEERRRLGEEEFEEAIRRATEIRGEATEIEAIGLRNAQVIRVEGERLVGAAQLQSASQGVEFSGSAAEVAGAAAAAAEFAATEESRAAGRAADALLFEAGELERLGQEQRRAGIIGADSILTQGKFEAELIRFGAPSTASILSDAIKPIQSAVPAVTESLLSIRKARSGDLGGVSDSFIAGPFETVDF